MRKMGDGRKTRNDTDTAELSWECWNYATNHFVWTWAYVLDLISREDLLANCDQDICTTNTTCLVRRLASACSFLLLAGRKPDHASRSCPKPNPRSL